jgi:D-arabinose 1-dehydrogenase-like Zn-dependent alcohol dehydrogenase
MRALLAYSTSTTPVLEEVSPPELGPADVRIQVAAAAVNPIDIAVLTGPVRALAGLPDPIGLGWDVSGTVSEVGDEVSGLQPGDRVAGILHVIGLKPGVGAHADETVLPANAVALVPDGIDLVEAASLRSTRSPLARPSTCSALPRGAPCWSPAAPVPSAGTPSSWPPVPAGGSPHWLATPTRTSWCARALNR